MRVDSFLHSKGVIVHTEGITFRTGCVFCGGGDDDRSLSVHRLGGHFRCHRCGATGSRRDLVRFFTGEQR